MNRGDAARSGRKLRMGFVLDVVGYGARTAPLQNQVQRRLPELVRNMLAKCGLLLAEDEPERTSRGVECEWTGDGINALLPADMDPTVVLSVLIRSLAAELDADNVRNRDRIQMRMAVGIGLVEHSAAGFGGPMIVEINRLVSSKKLREALLADDGADLAVAVSDQVHSMIIKPGYPGIPGAQFRPAQVTEKEFSGTAWIWTSTRQWSTDAYLPLGPGDPQRVGEYRITALIGSGPAARVYLASAPDGDSLAVKVLNPVTGAGYRRRLEAGVLTGQLVRGPHIARVVAADPGATLPWIASALVLGPSLAAVIAETGPLPARAALWLTVGVAQALAALHEDDLTHAGLSPSNVLLSAAGPMVTDAGVNHAALTAPWPTREADDVFALGCVALFAATGRSPAVPGDPDPGDCPPDLLPFIMDCLDKDPARRPAAHALATRLTDAAGQPPRGLLPPPVAARLEDYYDFTEPRSSPRARFRWLPR
jgi:hypothetical protein